MAREEQDPEVKPKPATEATAGYDAVMAKINADRAAKMAQNDEEKKRIDKLGKSRAAIAGIADAARAIGSLHYTTQYAPNSYDPNTAMRTKATERYERAKAELAKTHEENMRYIDQLEKQENNRQAYNFREQQMELNRQAQEDRRLRDFMNNEYRQKKLEQDKANAEALHDFLIVDFLEQDIKKYSLLFLVGDVRHLVETLGMGFRHVVQ